MDIASKGEYNELARIAKDVAAGGVFVAAMSALVVGYLVFSGSCIQFLMRR